MKNCRRRPENLYRHVTGRFILGEKSFFTIFLMKSRMLADLSILNGQLPELTLTVCPASSVIHRTCWEKALLQFEILSVVKVQSFYKACSASLNLLQRVCGRLKSGWKCGTIYAGPLKDPLILKGRWGVFCSRESSKAEEFYRCIPKVDRWSTAYFLSTNLHHADMIWSIKTKDGSFLVCSRTLWDDQSNLPGGFLKQVCCKLQLLQPVFQKTNPTSP